MSGSRQGNNKSCTRCPRDCEFVRYTKVRVSRVQDCDNDTYVDTDENLADPDVVHIRSNNGTFIDGDPSVTQVQGAALQGSGRKFYWYPAKGALRSGEVTDDAWDDVNVGTLSTAVGLDTIASGNFSFAGGQDSVASGPNSNAFGRGPGTLVAQGDSSTVAGIAEGGSVVAASGLASDSSGLSSGGGNITSSGAGATARGFTNAGNILSSGEGAKAGGSSVFSGTIESTGAGSFAHGRAEGVLSGISAQGSGSFSQGQALAVAGLPGVITSSSEGAVAHGAALGGNIASTGIGSTVGGNSNSGSVIGATGLGTLVHGVASNTSNITSNGNGSLVVASVDAGGNVIENGIGNAIFAAVSAGGDITINAPAIGCVASGLSSVAPGISATGNGATARGFAQAEGVAASGDGATAIGVDTSALANYAYATGLGTISNVEGVFVHGRFGQSKATVVPPGEGAVDLRYSWQLAGGTSPADRAPPEQGISALIFTQVFGNDPQGAMMTNVYYTGGADFAEYFEWEDGNKHKEDRVGYFVSISGKEEKMAIQKGVSNTIGVVSATAGLVGDAGLHWKDANLKDNFGRTILREDILTEVNAILARYELPPVQSGGKEAAEDRIKSSYLTEERKKAALYEVHNSSPLMVAVPNPEKRKEAYVPRNQRLEWSPVAVVGKVFVRDNGKCEPGGLCDAVGGIAVPGNKYHVLSRKGPNVVRILLK